MQLTLTQSLSLPAAWQTPNQYTGNDGDNLVVSIAASTTNQLVNASIPIATPPIFLSMLASGADLTVKTNSSGSPAQTITLKDGVPLLWDGAAAYFGNPITTGITALYVTNSSGNAATLTITVLYS